MNRTASRGAALLVAAVLVLVLFSAMTVESMAVTASVNVLLVVLLVVGGVMLVGGLWRGR